MTDYCGACGEPLTELPSGVRVACHPGAAMYWSPHEPLPDDARGFRQMTGLGVRTQTEWYDFKFGSESYGLRIIHKPVHLYRRPS